MWNLALFFRLINIYVYAYWMAVLHSPATIHLKARINIFLYKQLNFFGQAFGCLS